MVFKNRYLHVYLSDSYHSTLTKCASLITIALKKLGKFFTLNSFENPMLCFSVGLDKNDDIHALSFVIGISSKQLQLYPRQISAL